MPKPPPMQPLLPTLCRRAALITLFALAATGRAVVLAGSAREQDRCRAVKASSRPSGDQATSLTSSFHVATERASPPPAGMTQISVSFESSL